jgi:Icc-related predicted phosphoesterase
MYEISLNWMSAVLLVSICIDNILNMIFVRELTIICNKIQIMHCLKVKVMTSSSSPINIQISSDWHSELDYYQPHINADILILAGDIHKGSQCEALLTKIAEEHPNLHIIYVLGNHEFFDSTLKAERQYWKSVKIPNVHILDNESIVINDIQFIGATLWTDFDNGKLRNIGEKYYSEEGIKDVTVDDIIVESQTSIKYIKSALEANLEEYGITRKIVISHHLPTYKSIADKFKDSISSCCYASHFDTIITTHQPLIWVHGHTHSSFDYYIGKTRIICNPHGYVQDGKIENSQFKDQLVITI